MPEIKIQKDIRNFKTKDIGNFTFAQAGAIALMGVTGFLTYKGTGSWGVALIPASLVAVVAFFRPMGMSFITFVRTFVKEAVISPKVYVNESDFEYDEESISPYANDYDLTPIAVIQTDEGLNKKRSKSDLEQIIR